MDHFVPRGSGSRIGKYDSIHAVLKATLCTVRDGPSKYRKLLAVNRV